MNNIEEAVIYATIMHQGKVRKLGNTTYILHPLEVTALPEALPDTGTLPHGYFHTNNAFLLQGEPLLIDMDRLST